MSMYFLGVDGGQSSTIALIGDETGRVLGSGRGGPCNHVGMAEGRARFAGAMRSSLEGACAAAGLSPSRVRFSRACFGLSGGPAERRAILEEILQADEMVISHDGLIALSGATAGGPGIITIAGTGSISFGRNAQGRVARAGGWGYVYGDEGAGFDIARQAVRAILRMEEGWGPVTVLFDKLLAATGASSADDVLHRFYGAEFPRTRVAAYAKLVDEAALDGDAVAREILERAAQDLAGYTAAVRRQLFASGEEVPVCYIGGAYRSGLLLERFRMLVELEAGNHVAPPCYGPAAGALIEAYRAAGICPVLQNVPELK